MNIPRQDTTPSKRQTAIISHELSGLSIAEFRKHCKAQLESNTYAEWKPSFDLSSEFNTADNVIGIFWGEAKWNEASLQNFNWPKNTQLAFPRCSESEITFYFCNPKELVFNTDLAIHEAPKKASSVTPKTIFIPALAADLKGNRIGRGKGFYDRYLTRNKNVTSVAVLHSDFIFPEIPQHWLHSGDQRVNYICCENSLLKSKET